jgi:ribonuclease P protein component
MDMSKVCSLSFPKACRLIRSREFDRVKRDGRVVRGELMLLDVLAVQNSGASRVGFITSRRLGNAVVRNRVRRLLREIVRKCQRDLRHGLWIVLIARRRAGNASYRVLEDEWLRLAKRASILAP